MSEINIIKVTTEEQLAECHRIRTIVFVDEQNVARHEEFDGLDPEAEHYLLTIDGAPSATARVRHLENIAKIERVAVLKSCRGLNIGWKIMRAIMEDCQQNPAITTLKLGAQTHALAFYEKLGFHCFGDEFLDAGIPHRWMTYSLT